MLLYGHVRTAHVRRTQSGFSLIEVLVATVVLTSGVVGLAHLFSLATLTNVAARSTTFTSVLAQQKLEELRSIAWDQLAVSPPGALVANTGGFVDHLDEHGRLVNAGVNPPPSALYTRRWSIAPVNHPSRPLLLIQVAVTHRRDGERANAPDQRRLVNEARLMTLRGRVTP